MPMAKSSKSKGSKPRIIAGSAKGRVLEIPRSGTRPSPARLREALFNILAFREKSTFLDLYSGSGAIGLEAASRGWQVSCVELSRAAAEVLQRNATHLRLEAEVIQADALKYIQAKPRAFKIVFAAPPYPLDLNEIFQTILTSKVASEIYIFQHPSDRVVALGGDSLAYKSYSCRVYGANSLTFLEL